MSVDNKKTTDQEEEALRSAFYKEQLQGRQHLNNSAFEYSLQAFANCLHMCETNPSSLSDLKYEVLGNIGWVNRLMGRYDLAIKYLSEALVLADSTSAATTTTLGRVQIDAELGTVYRLADRHEEARGVFTRLYSLAKKQMGEVRESYEKYAWKRVACRAVGNLGMANYQRALQLWSAAHSDPSANKNSSTDRDIKQRTRDLIQQAMSQLRERIRLAEEIAGETSGGHGEHSRISQARCWQGIGYARLSLCHTALADLEPSHDDKTMQLKKAVETAEQGAKLVSGESAITLSRFFHGRALLRWARHQTTGTSCSTSGSISGEPHNDIPEQYREQILDKFGPRVSYINPYTSREVSYEIVTPAIALSMEPSTEHRGYLRELVDAGADFEASDPQTGYTALDYAVFSGDVEAEEIVLDGLRKQHRSRTGENLPNRRIEGLRQEARLRKGHREIFQERLRPELMKGSLGIERWKEDARTTARNHAVRRRALRDLRRTYAAALNADKIGMGVLFDRLRVMKYRDFVEFGRLPRSNDGLARPFAINGGPGIEQLEESNGDDEVVIFFSYRWINTDPGLNSPDDVEQTQYQRMIAAAESYLEIQDGLVSRDKLMIWMDFACVDQDDPQTGVSALPLIIAQCDAVITLRDDSYFDRAWCCVEAAMIQTLRTEYHLHEWFEQVPSMSSCGSPDQDSEMNSDVGSNQDVYSSEGIEGHTSTSTHMEVKNENERHRPQWRLRHAKYREDLDMADKKLSYETDRPKVLFLERQIGFLRRSRSY